MGFFDFLHRAVDKIETKHQQAMEQFSQGIINISLPDNGLYSSKNTLTFDFLHGAVDKIKNKHQKAMEQFSQGILNISVLDNDLNQSKNTPTIIPRQTHILQNQNSPSQQDPRSLNQSSGLEVYSQTFLQILQTIAFKNSQALQDFAKSFERMTIKQQSPQQRPNQPAQSISQLMPSLKNPENFQTLRDSEKIQKNKKKLASLEKSQQISRPKNQISSLKNSLSIYKLQEDFQNPETLINPTSQKQKTAKEILQEIQQIHSQKSIQKLKIHKQSLQKSINKRTKVIEMKKQMIEKLREKKEKQAQEKIKMNIEFLQSLKIKPRKQNPTFKQFRNISSSSEKLKESIRIKTYKKTDNQTISDSRQSGPNFEKKKRYLKSIKGEDLEKSSIFLENPIRLPILDSKKGALRPKPYSVYHLSQKGSQMFRTNRAN